MKYLNLQSFGILFGAIGLIGFIASCTNTTSEKASSNQTVVITAPAPVAAPAPAPARPPVRLPAPPSIMDQGGITTLPGSSASSGPVYVSYKSFLVSSDPITTRPYSFVYFGKPATTEKLKKQYILICQMYMDTFSDKEETEAFLDIQKEKLIPVFWFSKYKKDDKTCETLVKDYDYRRARSLINLEVKAPPTPSLVARFGKFSIVMELNGLDNQEDLDLAFSTWKEKIATFPEKDYDMTVISIVYSAKKVLGALGQILYYTKS